MNDLEGVNAGRTEAGREEVDHPPPTSSAVDSFPNSLNVSPPQVQTTNAKMRPKDSTFA